MTPGVTCAGIVPTNPSTVNRSSRGMSCSCSARLSLFFVSSIISSSVLCRRWRGRGSAVLLVDGERGDGVGNVVPGKVQAERRLAVLFELERDAVHVEH